MSNTYFYLYFAVLSIVTIFLEAQKFLVVLGKNAWKKGITFKQALCFAAEYAFIMLWACRGRYLFLFLVGYLVVEWISTRQFSEVTETMKWFSMLEVLMTGCSILIILGFSGMRGNHIGQLCRITEIRFLALTAAEGLTAVFCVAWEHLFKIHDNIKEDDSRKSKLFRSFLWCCAAYAYIDSLLIEFPFYGFFVPVLVITGNLLTLLLAYMFLHHNYLLALNQIGEEEYASRRAQKARLHYQQERMNLIARIDGLTGAYTRRYGCTLLGQMLEKNIPVTVAFIDLDGLKKINDENGHAAGDRCLKDFAGLFMKQLRENDLFIRIGGDEFLVVLPYAPEDKMREKIESIRESMSQTIKGGPSFSFGMASGEKDIEELVKKADQNMYEDKKRIH